MESRLILPPTYSTGNNDNDDDQNNLQNDDGDENKVDHDENVVTLADEHCC